MGARLSVIATFVAVFLLGVPAVARAQTAPSELEVRVGDAGGKPLADARVYLSGGPGVVTSALTPREGVIRFADVEPGLYALRIALAGYDGVDVNDVEILPGRRKVVEVTLTRSRPRGANAAPANATASDAALKEIGRVQARPPVSVTSVDVDEGNPIRRVSENLADALDKIAGVSVQQAPNSGTLTISLRNQDPSTTLATAGGAPLQGGGAAGLQAVASDLSSGVSVDNPNNIGALGGSVNFRTLEPTKTWQSQASFSYGSYERGSAAFSLSGGHKKLGIAVQHAVRGSDDILTGLGFADTSGQTYAHDGANNRFADFIKLRYSTGPRLTLNASYLAGHSRSSLICHDFVTNLPCGYGAGNESRFDVHNAVFGINAQIGNVTTFAGVYGSANHSLLDESNRFVSGTPQPYEQTIRGSGTGYYTYSKVAVRRHTIALASGNYAGTQNVSSAGAFQGKTASPVRNAYAALNDELKMSDRWSVSVGLGTESTTAAATVATYAGVTFTPSRSETVALSFSTGANGANFASHLPFGDPASATYNCPAGEVRITGPGDSPAAGIASSVQVEYNRRGRRGTLHLGVYDRVDHGGFIQAQFPLLGLGLQIPAGYIDAIRQIWDRAAICGGTAFDPGRVFLAEQVAGNVVRYRGVDASGQIVLGRQTVALPSYSINGAVLESSDPRLVAPGSPYFVGAQLPFRPLHRAGLTLDTRQPRANLEYLLDGRWTSANNTFALTSYVVVTAGVTWQAPRGRLTALATNLFNADTGLFATQEFAQPLGLRGGGTYVPIPTLLQPRTYSLLYTVRAGRLK